MLTLERHNDPITEYFRPWNSQIDDAIQVVKGVKKYRKSLSAISLAAQEAMVRAILQDLQAVPEINSEDLRTRLLELQRVLDDNNVQLRVLDNGKIIVLPNPTPTKAMFISPIKSLFIDMFVHVGIFALLSAITVSLVHYLYSSPFVTRIAWGQKSLYIVFTTIIISNLVLLSVSTARTVVRTLATV